MLQNDIKDEDLVEWRDRLKKFIPEEAQDYFIESNTETNIDFPVNKYPEKPKSLNLEKQQQYSGKLVGIKGQYLIFEDDTVFNVRANEGLVVTISIN
jgi:D-serine dehydratase